MKSFTTFNELYDRYEFKRLLEDTSKYTENNYVDDTTVFSAYFYRIVTYIYIGDFENAEMYAYKVLEGSSNVKNRSSIYSLLADIYFYTGDFFLSYYYFKKSSFNSCIRFHYLAKMVSNFYADYDDSKCNRLKYIPNEVLIKHVKKSHQANFSFNLNKFIKCIKDNYYSAKPYYQNFSIIKYFRCNGYLYSDYKGKGTACQYIKVVSLRDDPSSIVTFYPIDHIGDLEPFDISEDFYKDLNKWKSNEEIQRTIKHKNKFYERQSKKNS